MKKPTFQIPLLNTMHVIVQVDSEVDVFVRFEVRNIEVKLRHDIRNEVAELIVQL